MTESKATPENLKDKIDKAYASYPKIFPKYYAIYDGILRLVETVPISSDLPSKEEFEKIQFFLNPLIKIINYKSQKPFPKDCYPLIKLIAEIKQCTPSKQLSEDSKERLKKLLDINGIGLPTASAIMHFCHPSFFPIVDTYVISAYTYLVSKYDCIFDKNIFKKIDVQSKSVALDSYQLLINFINRIIETTKNDRHYTLKEIDNALMVLGKEEKAKAKAEKKGSEEKSS